MKSEGMMPRPAEQPAPKRERAWVKRAEDPQHSGDESGIWEVSDDFLEVAEKSNKHRSAFRQVVDEAQREIGNLHYALKLQEFAETGDRQTLDQLFMLTPETKMRLIKAWEEKELAKKERDAALDQQLAEAQREIEAERAHQAHHDKLFGPIPEDVGERTIITKGAVSRRAS